MKTSILTALSALVILHVVPLHVRAVGTDLSIPKPSEPASREDQKALWKKVEQLSFAAVAGADSVKRAVALEQDRLPDGEVSGLAIGDRLTGTNVALQLDPAGKLKAGRNLIRPSEAASRRELFCRSIPICLFFRFRTTRGPIRLSAPLLEVLWPHSQWPRAPDHARSV